MYRQVVLEMVHTFFFDWNKVGRSIQPQTVAVTSAICWLMHQLHHFWTNAWLRQIKSIMFSPYFVESTDLECASKVKGKGWIVTLTASSCSAWNLRKWMNQPMGERNRQQLKLDSVRVWFRTLRSTQWVSSIEFRRFSEFILNFIIGMCCRFSPLS